MVTTPYTCPSTRLGVAVSDGDVYLLTPCCGASGKGGESPTGVVCRRCYEPVSGVFGTSAAVADEAAVYALVERAMTSHGCKVPAECADLAAHRVVEHVEALAVEWAAA